MRDPVSEGSGQLLRNDPMLSSDLYLHTHSNLRPLHAYTLKCTLTHAPTLMNTHKKDLNSRIENSSLCTYEGNLCPCPSSFLTSRFHGTTWHCPLTPAWAIIGAVLHAGRVMCGTASGLPTQLGLIQVSIINASWFFQQCTEAFPPAALH